MLLVLLCGPLLQVYDCFNDSPVVDHDALLHTSSPPPIRI
jgi:hypothetical protein